jgi:hypothetical protein
MRQGPLRASVLAAMTLFCVASASAQSRQEAFTAFLGKGLDDWRRSLSCNVLHPQKEQQTTLELWAYIRKDLVDIADKGGASPQMKLELLLKTETSEMMKATTGTTGDLIAFCQGDPGYFKRRSEPPASTMQLDLERILAQP